MFTKLLPLGFALIPDAASTAELVRIHQELHKIHPSSFVLRQHDALMPHVSLFQGRFAQHDVPSLIFGIHTVVQQHRDDIPALLATEKLTLWLERIIFLDIHTTSALCAWQQALINLADPVRQKHHGAADPQTLHGLNTNEQWSYDNYAYPFALAAFRPHVTMGRVAKSNHHAWPNTAQILNNDIFFPKMLSFSGIVLFEVGEYGSLKRLAHTVSFATIKQPCAKHTPTLERLVAATECAMFNTCKEKAQSHLADITQQLSSASLRSCAQIGANVAAQKQLVQEHSRRYDLMHAAGSLNSLSYDVLSRSIQLRCAKKFVAMHTQACIAATAHTTSCWKMWQRETELHQDAAHKQAYLINFSRDNFLLNTQGILAAPFDADKFVNLSLIPFACDAQVPIQVLVGQGPQTPQHALDYVGAALKYAESAGLSQVTFCNAAGAQINDFSSEVKRISQRLGLTAHYREVQKWSDGSIPENSSVIDMARCLADHPAESDAPALLVINCYGGLDRSGIIAVLAFFITQKRILRDACDPLSTMFHLVRQLKMARPHGITTPARFLYLCRLAATLARLPN